MEKNISFTITISDEITYEELKEFIEYHLEITCVLSGKNPLNQKEMSDLQPRDLSI